jgi:hypothetical protein
MLEIIEMPIGDIRPFDRNAKEHPKEQVEQIRRSIEAFGMNDPLAIDEQNVIIEGHGRFLALIFSWVNWTFCGRTTSTSTPPCKPPPSPSGAMCGRWAATDSWWATPPL